MSASKQAAILSAGKTRKPNAKAVITPKAYALSTEYVDDSESETESKNEDVTSTLRSTGHSATPKIKSFIPARPVTTTKATIPLAAKPEPDVTATVGGGPVSSSSSSASGSDSEGSSESENESEESTQGKTVAQKQTKKPAQPLQKLSQLQSPYTPPPGYEPGLITLPSFAEADLLSMSSLQGKQIWHFTVPASVPVDSIKEVSMRSVQKGESALSYKGADYGFVADGERQKVAKTLLVPDQGNNNYRPAALAISQTLHLQQLVRVPSMGTAADGPADSAQTPAGLSRGFRKAARPQPKGMKMRYLPLGDNDGQFGRMGPGSSTSGDSEDEPQFRIPTIVSSSSKRKKRKHSASNGPNFGHQPPEERRLKRSRPEADHLPEEHGSTETSPMDIDSQVDKVREEVIDNSSEAVVASGAGQQPAKRSSEDRAKRKEEKRWRKKEMADSAESKGGPESGHSD